MDTGGLITKKYLSPSAPTFWEWGENGEAVTLVGGGVLAFRIELAEALDPMKANGLPPIGAVLIALHATKRPWKTIDTTNGAWAETIQAYERQGQRFPDGLIKSVGGKLNTFHNVMTGLDDRELIHTGLSLLFDGCVLEVPGSAAGDVIESLRAGPPPDMLMAEQSRDGFDRLRLDLTTLDAGLDRVTADAIHRRHETGIENEVLPAELPDLPESRSDAALNLISELEQDPEHASLGRLTRQLLSAIRLPRGLGVPQDMPIGGLNDITNRGQLDRLLISELAQDDLTLAIRIANNEALYLRREESQARPPIHRHVLIDLGLKQWGVPRLLSVATALALHAESDEQIELSCWCATHGGTQLASPISRDGIDALLSRLEVNLSPTRAIDQLAEDIEPDSSTELVVIMSQSSLEDAHVAQSLRRFNKHAVYLIGVDRSGRVEVVVRTDKGLRPHSHTTVEVEHLLAYRLDSSPPLTDMSRSPDLPAAIRQTRLRLRIPHQFKYGSAWHCDEGQGQVYVVTKDYRLTRWDDWRYGPVELCDTLPANEVLWCSTHGPSEIDALLGRIGKHASVYALSINHTTGSVSYHPIELPEDERVFGVIYHRGTVIVVTRSKAYAIEPGSGRVLSERVIRDKRHVLEMRGRFVRMSNQQWLGLTSNGTKVQTVPNDVRDRVPLGSRVTAVFQADGVESFVNITDNGIVFLSDKTRDVRCQVSKGHIRVVTARWSHTGRQIMLQVMRDGLRKEYVLVKVEPDKITVENTYTYSPGDSWLEQDISKRCLRRSPRVKFTGVGIAEDDQGQAQLILITRYVHLTIELFGRSLVAATRAKKPLRHQANFKPIPSPPGTQYKLAEADFAEGGRVVHDSRGMLHLQPRDKSLAEVTLVVENDSVSGWCSDSSMFGDLYYSGERQGDEARRLLGEEVLRSYIEPILRGMR